MKKNLVLLLLSFIIINSTACGKSTANDYPPMIMVDRTVYYVSSTTYTGTVHLESVKTVLSFTDAVPEMDGQCNFDRELKTKYATTTEGVIVFFDGEWKECYTDSSRPETYVYSTTVYMNPLSSYYPSGTTGVLYYMGNDCFDISDEKTGVIIASFSFDSSGWVQISEEEWLQLFTVLPPDISSVLNPLMMRLSDQFFLFNMDRRLWIGEYSGEENGMWSIYELEPY